MKGRARLGSQHTVAIPPEIDTICQIEFFNSILGLGNKSIYIGRRPAYFRQTALDDWLRVIDSVRGPDNACFPD